MRFTDGRAKPEIQVLPETPLSGRPDRNVLPRLTGTQVFMKY